VLARAHHLHDDPRAKVGIWAGFPDVRFDQLDSPFPYLLVFAQMKVERILAERAQERRMDVLLQGTVSTRRTRRTR